MFGDVFPASFCSNKESASAVIGEGMVSSMEASWLWPGCDARLGKDNKYEADYGNSQISGFRRTIKRVFMLKEFIMGVDASV